MRLFRGPTSQTKSFFLGLQCVNGEWVWLNGQKFDLQYYWLGTAASCTKNTVVIVTYDGVASWGIQALGTSTSIKIGNICVRVCISNI